MSECGGNCNCKEVDPTEWKDIGEDDKSDGWSFTSDKIILKPDPIKRDQTSFEAVVRALFAEAADLLLSKHNDYGPLNISLSPGGAMNGLRVRLYDKIARLNNLIDSGREPEHESIEDTWRDIVGYGAIGLLVSRGEWPDA